MKFTLVLFILFVFSCNAHKNSSTDSMEKLVDNSATIDSLKWSYYVYNYSSLAVFHDTLTRNKITFSPVECDIVFDGSATVSKDSIYYMFSLTKPGYKFGFVDPGIADRLAIINGNITPILQHGYLNITKYPDSVKHYYDLANVHFIEYLKNYKGSIGEWLKKQALKNKILFN